MSRDDFFIPHFLSEEKIGDLDVQALLTQILVWGHWLDKEMQLASSGSVEFSRERLLHLSRRLSNYHARFSEHKPLIAWAERIKAMYEKALEQPAAFQYEWQEKELLRLKPEELEMAMRTRRSVRFFRKEKIPHSLLLKLIECAQWGPTNCNQQSLRFIVVEDSATLHQLREGGMRGEMCPCLIVTLADLRFYSGNDAECPAHDCGAALQNLLLMAHVRGLGACYTSSRHVNCQLHREILGVKNYEKIMAIIWLGYYDRMPIPPERKSVGEIVQFL